MTTYHDPFIIYECNTGNLKYNRFKVKELLGAV